MARNNYNGNGRFVSSWNLPVLISALAIMLTITAGFWSVADPRGTIAKLENRFDQYVTIREFEENKKNTVAMRILIHKEIDSLKKDLDELVKVLGSGNTIGDRLKYIQEQISNLRDKVLIPPREVIKP